MKFSVRRFFSGFCSYEIDADDEISAYEKAKALLIDEDEILSTLKDWKECDEVIPENDYSRKSN